MTSTLPERRQTRQRIALAEELSRSPEFRSAQDIHTALADAGIRVGLATVYRNLQAMAAEEEIDCVRMPDGEARYRSCDSSGHHHHLVCRTCGRTVEVTATAVERWAEAVAADHGFAQVRHTLEIDGICRTCSPDA